VPCVIKCDRFPTFIYHVDNSVVSNSQAPFTRQFSSKGLSEVWISLEISYGGIQSSLQLNIEFSEVFFKASGDFEAISLQIPSAP